MVKLVYYSIRIGHLLDRRFPLAMWACELRHCRSLTLPLLAHHFIEVLTWLRL